MKRVSMVFTVVWVMVLAGPLAAQETVQLEEVVVTASRTEEKVEQVPANVTVITEEEIENSTAATVQDLLEQEAGVVLYDLYGTGSRSVVDLRGFGRGLNTAILIDGRKVNQIDLSGVEWNLIPLENVERIEIVRGSGSVLYGDNANAGVINIITKRGAPDEEQPGVPAVDVAGRYESYDGYMGSATVSGGTDVFSYYVFGKYRETDGYRENSEFRAKDAQTTLGWNISDIVYLDVRGGYHEDDQGLPGGLTEEELEDDRTQSASPKDKDEVTYDQYYAGGTLGVLLGEMGELSLGYHFDSREFDSSVFFDLGSGPESFNTDRDTDTNEYTLKLTVRPDPVLLVTGIDFREAEADTLSTSSLSDVTSGIEKEEMGYYGHAQVDVWKLTLAGGYRYADTEFSDRISGQSFGFDVSGEGLENIDEEAWRAGVALNYLPGSKVFVNWSKGYRLPTTDELFAFTGEVVDLRPEKSETYEAGVVHRLRDTARLSFTYFQMDVRDELIFNPVAFLNENLDETRHRGIEAGFDYGVSEWVRLDGSWTYTEAEFKSGPNKGKTVPLIPENQATLSAVFDYWKTTVVVAGTWVDDRFMENDLDNTRETLDSYTTVDLKLTFNDEHGDFYVGVDNVFDEEYVAYGAAGFMTEALYPAPERTYYTGISMRF